MLNGGGENIHWDTHVPAGSLFKLVQGSQFRFLVIFYTKSTHRRNFSFKHEIMNIGKIVMCYLQPNSGARNLTIGQSWSWNFWITHFGTCNKWTSARFWWNVRPTLKRKTEQ